MGAELREERAERGAGRRGDGADGAGAAGEDAGVVGCSAGESARERGPTGDEVRGLAERRTPYLRYGRARRTSLQSAQNHGRNDVPPEADREQPARAAGKGARMSHLGRVRDHAPPALTQQVMVKCAFPRLRQSAAASESSAASSATSSSLEAPPARARRVGAALRMLTGVWVERE